MKNMFTGIVLMLTLTFGASGLKVMAQNDAIYVTPKQNKTWQKEEKEKQKAQRERAEQLRLQREQERQREQEEEAYYYDPVDENGFSEYEIDAYNRRTEVLNDDNSRSNSAQMELQDGKRHKNNRGGTYTNRIKRFHNDDAVVVVEGEEIYIITDEGYYDGDDYYGYGDDGGGTVNIYVYDGAGWNDFYPSSYPWYDPWWNPWSYGWYDPWYYSPWYYRNWGWGGFSWSWGNWHFGFGWGPSYHYSWPGYSWHNGYSWGYNDGFWDGYYLGAGYDPYCGSYYYRDNYYPYGRRSGNYGRTPNGNRRGDYNSGRKENRVYNASRNSYARGNYWTDDRYRTTDNVAATNWGTTGRNAAASPQKRGVFGDTERQPSRIGGNQRSVNNNNRVTGRVQKATNSSNEINRSVESSRRTEDRGVFRISRNAREKNGTINRQVQRNSGNYQKGNRQIQRYNGNSTQNNRQIQRNNRSTQKQDSRVGRTVERRSNDSYRSSSRNSSSRNNSSFGSSRSGSTSRNSSGTSRNSSSRRR